MKDIISLCSKQNSQVSEKVNNEPRFPPNGPISSNCSFVASFLIFLFHRMGGRERFEVVVLASLKIAKNEVAL